LTANATIPANATAPVRHQRVTTSPDPRSILASTTDEAIEVLQALWREPIASYHGRFYRFDAASMEPRPPEGAPPIWVAGNAPGGIRRAAQYGSGWLPYCMDLAAFRAGVATLRDLTRGRGGPTIDNMFYVRIEKPAEPAVVPSTSPWVEGRFAGSADAVAKHLERYRQAGLAYALCGFESEGLDDLLRLFASSPIGSRRSSPTLNSRTNTRSRSLTWAMARRQRISRPNPAMNSARSTGGFATRSYYGDGRTVKVRP
jgi:Luciferase-like monooxygenase